MYDATGGNVVMVGHSLGGGLATAAGTMPRYSRGNHAGIRAHYIEGDILNTCRRCRSRRPEPTARAYATAIPGGGGAPWNATRSRIPCYCERMRGPVGHTLAMIGAVGMLVGAGAGAACSATNGLKAADYFTTAVAVQAAERIRRGDVRGLSRGIAEGLAAGTRGREGMDLLKWSWAWACEGCFELLLRNGAGTGHVQAGRYTGKVEQLFLMPIMELAAQSRDSRYLSLLLEHGGDPNAPDVYGNKPIIHGAIIHSRLANIRLLVAAGADIEARDGDLATPLHTAVSVDSSLRARVSTCDPPVWTRCSTNDPPPGCGTALIVWMGTSGHTQLASYTRWPAGRRR